MRPVFCIALLSSCLTQFGSSSPEVDMDDGVKRREPMFRKDYILDEQRQGWFKRHQIADTWHEARDRCELEGAELASPLNTEMSDTIKDLIQKSQSTVFFTGTHSLFSYGDYYSLKGVPLSEMAVAQSCLSSDNNKRCVTINSDGEIVNANCNDQYPYICYRHNDFTQLTNCGTIDTEYKMSHEMRTCYKLHNVKRSWHGAFKACSAEGGHLLVINSIEELREVTKLLPIKNVTDAVEAHPLFGKERNPFYSSSRMIRNITTNSNVLVGVIDWQGSGEYVTIHGEKIQKSEFYYWNPTTPFYFSSRSCGAMNASGQLITVPCSGEIYRFICEKSPSSLLTLEQYFTLISYL